MKHGQLETNLVYKIPCSDYNLCYVGESLQYLSSRVDQHKSDEKKHKKDLAKSIIGGTALAQHVRDYQHSFNFSQIKILAKEDNTKKTKIPQNY